MKEISERVKEVLSVIDNFQSDTGCGMLFTMDLAEGIIHPKAFSKHTQDINKAYLEKMYGESDTFYITCEEEYNKWIEDSEDVSSGFLQVFNDETLDLISDNVIRREDGTIIAHIG